MDLEILNNIKALAEIPIIALLCFAIWQIWKANQANQKALLEIVKQNTKAFTELSGAIENLKDKMNSLQNQIHGLNK